MKTAGQSIIEVMFVVGLVAVLVGAVASLTVASLNSKNRRSDREKALQLAEKAVEEYTSEAVSDSVGFWAKMQSGSVETETALGGYNLTATFSLDSSGCEGSRCGKIVVEVRYTQDQVSQTVTIEKKFVKNLLI